MFADQNKFYIVFCVKLHIYQVFACFLHAISNGTLSLTYFDVTNLFCLCYYVISARDESVEDVVVP